MFNPEFRTKEANIGPGKAKPSPPIIPIPKQSAAIIERKKTRVNKSESSVALLTFVLIKKKEIHKSTKTINPIHFLVA